jgi:TatD DNase family protein
MFDTHAHVHDKAFDLDREAVLERAREAGVERILTIGTDLASSRDAREVALRYGLDYAIGIHPHEAKDAPADLAEAFDAFIAGSQKAPRAIGEMGLDYYYDHSPRDVQREVLAKGIRYARERGFPAIFHERDAFADFVAVLRAEAPHGLRGVVHCFTGDTAAARVLVEDFGLYLGIGGVMTFKNAQALRDAVAAVGLDHVILETDAPYLAPVPHRGRRNEPAFVAATAAAMAGIFGTSVERVVTRTNASATALFGEPAGND